MAMPLLTALAAKSDLTPITARWFLVMKKIMFVSAFLSVFSWTGFTYASEEVVVREGIGTFVAKATAGKPVTVAYLGGSITEMNGWRNLTTVWLKKEFPQAKVKEVGAAIGGTGSDLGVFRTVDGYVKLRHAGTIELAASTADQVLDFGNRTVLRLLVRF